MKARNREWAFALSQYNTKLMEAYYESTTQRLQWRTVCVEEIFWSVWASMGVPDGATEDDYEDLKESDEFWTDCLEAFMRCVLLDAKNHED